MSAHITTTIMTYSCGSTFAISTFPLASVRAPGFVASLSRKIGSLPIRLRLMGASRIAVSTKGLLVTVEIMRALIDALPANGVGTLA